MNALPANNDESLSPSRASAKTLMHRSDWELAAYINHRVAEISSECQTCTPIARGEAPSKCLLTQLRQRLGIGLIQIGQALVGHRAAVAPSTARRSAAWGQPGD